MSYKGDDVHARVAGHFTKDWERFNMAYLQIGDLHR